MSSKNTVPEESGAPPADQRVRPFKAQMTPAEQALWNALRVNRLRGFQFRRQQMIGGYVADFYCYPARLAIELEGSPFAKGPEQDEERERLISTIGLRVMRLTNDEILNDLSGVLRRVVVAVDESIRNPRRGRPDSVANEAGMET